jgi:hypothetical protein
MRRIELGDFLLIAEIHSGIDAHQLARISRVINLAEAALAAPFAGFGNYEAFPAIHEKRRSIAPGSSTTTRSPTATSAPPTT